ELLSSGCDLWQSPDDQGGDHDLQRTPRAAHQHVTSSAPVSACDLWLLRAARGGSGTVRRSIAWAYAHATVIGTGLLGQRGGAIARGVKRRARFRAPRGARRVPGAGGGA